MAQFDESPSEAALEECLAWAASNAIDEEEFVRFVSLLDDKIGIARFSANQRISPLLGDLIPKLAALGGDGARAAATIAHALGMESASQLQALSLSLPSAFASRPRPLAHRVRHALNEFRVAGSEALRRSSRVALARVDCQIGRRLTEPSHVCDDR